MKKFSILLFFTLIISSCSNKELTQELAMPLVSNYYGFIAPGVTKKGDNINTHPMMTLQIAIDKKIEDYGWPPDKYKELQQQGIISLIHLPQHGFLGMGRIEASVAKKGKQFLENTRIWKTQTDGDKEQFIFKGYNINITNISISSNAKDKNAEAEVVFNITDISPIQQIFSPIKETAFKRNVSFKLFDDGWKIVEDQNSKIKIPLIDNPLHWAGN